MLKGLLGKLFKSDQNLSQEESHHMSQAEIETLIETKLKEHAATTDADANHNKQAANQDDYKLTAKQRDFALSILDKIKYEFELAIEPGELTVKDLNRLIGYQRYKNKGTLINLVKKGVLKKK